MATTFLEPGGDATFIALATTAGGFWSAGIAQSGTVVNDIVNGGHIKSIQYAANAININTSPDGVVSDSGGRASFYIYINVLPTATSTILSVGKTLAQTVVARIRLTSAGVLQLFESTNQIGSDGATLVAGVWYRLSIAFTIGSTTVNRFEIFKDGLSTISVTNATITNTGSTAVRFGNASGNVNLDLRGSDFYIDDSNSLTDPGNIWVTAKRPNANGTANNFATQIGSGGSGYGTGHSPQVNERALSVTNGWSVVAVGATTEEYNIESALTGDINIANSTIIDYMGWVYAKALLAETGKIVVNNVSSDIALTSTSTMFTKAAGSSTYPAGTGTDIGIITDATATTVSLFECGVMVAYIPLVNVPFNGTKFLQLTGVGV